MTTGMIDFMINSGLITDMAAIPVPDLAVPYAAPRAEVIKIQMSPALAKRALMHLFESLYYLLYIYGCLTLS